jgi:hypothetical protein
LEYLGFLGIFIDLQGFFEIFKDLRDFEGFFEIFKDFSRFGGFLRIFRDFFEGCKRFFE